jgi:putative pyruvate formate lyase activating enzyme
MTPENFHIDWAKSQLADCRLCPRQCRVNRLQGQRGWCKAAADVHWFMEYVGYGEEPELTPSHTLFLSNCSMDCIWCQTADEQAVAPHTRLTAQSLREIIARGKAEGARNLNLLGGEPVVNLPGLLLLFAELEDLPPIVWNSNSYCCPDVLEVLDGLVSVYAMDLKVFSPECAARLTGTPDYPEVAMARLTELYRRFPERILLRHLVLPGHFECCTRPSLEWIAGTLPGVRVSLQDYIVMPRARSDAALGRFLSAEEFGRAKELAESLGIPLVERLPGQTTAPTQAVQQQLDLGRAAAVDKAVDVELILTPGGKLFLRHPNRPAAAFAADIVNPQTGTREVL